MTQYPKRKDDDQDDLLDDSEEDMRWGILIDTKNRLQKLEALVRTLMVKPTGNQTANPVQAGEAVLAKAASAYQDADGLMALGEREISDATTMGIFSSYLAANDLTAARDVLIDVRERGHVAKAADAAQQVEQAFGAGTDSDFATYDARAAVSEMTARFGKLEQILSSFEARLSQLERRPQVAAPVDDGQILAKAAGPKRPRTKEETEARLHAQIGAYIDSPSVVGQLSSMVAAGRYAEVRKVLTGAKRAHDAAKIVAERKRF